MLEEARPSSIRPRLSELVIPEEFASSSGLQSFCLTIEGITHDSCVSCRLPERFQGKTNALVRHFHSHGFCQWSKLDFCTKFLWWFRAKYSNSRSILMWYLTAQLVASCMLDYLAIYNNRQRYMKRLLRTFASNTLPRLMCLPDTSVQRPV